MKQTRNDLIGDAGFGLVKVLTGTSLEVMIKHLWKAYMYYIFPKLILALPHYKEREELKNFVLHIAYVSLNEVDSVLFKHS
jgi:hypothetical protein